MFLGSWMIACSATYRPSSLKYQSIYSKSRLTMEGTRALNKAFFADSAYGQSNWSLRLSNMRPQFGASVLSQSAEQPSRFLLRKNWWQWRRGIHEASAGIFIYCVKIGAQYIDVRVVLVYIAQDSGYMLMHRLL